MNKKAEDIQAYWNNRASVDSSIQSTTMDIWLRHIEAEFLIGKIKKYEPRRICDIGCGDGLTTIKCAKENLTAEIFGFDYSDSMISNSFYKKQSLELVHTHLKMVGWHQGDGEYHYNPGYNYYFCRSKNK